MKFHFIGAIAFSAVFWAFRDLSTCLPFDHGKGLWYLSFIPLVVGLVEWIVFACQLLDKFEHIDKLQQVADGACLLRKDLAKASGELRDINRHVCDGFNVIAEIVSDRRAA